MTFNDISAYFENYARLHKAIQHTDDNKGFVAVHADNSADDFIKTCKRPTICVLVVPDKKLFPPKGENYNWDKNICFFILTKVGRAAEATVIAAQNDCEVIIDDFVTRLIADRHTDLLRTINQASITVQPVGPIADNLYGQCCMFGLTDEFNYLVDQSKWLAP
jgi:hypothetical protein